MTDDLIQEMSKKLGRSEAEVEKAFIAFASAVEDRLRSEGEVNLAGLGTLQRKEGDSTRFEASNALDQAVNFRWLGAGTPVTSDRPPSDAGKTVSVAPPSASGTVPPDLLEDPPMPDDHKPIRKVSWAPIGAVDPTDLGAPDKVAPEPAKAASPPAPQQPARAASPPPQPPARAMTPPPKSPAPVLPPTPAPPQVDPALDLSAPDEDLTYENLHKTTSGIAPKPGPSAAQRTAPAAQAARAQRRPRTSAARASETGAGNRRALLGVLALLAVVVIAAVLWQQFGVTSAGDDPAATAQTETPAGVEGEAANPGSEDPGQPAANGDTSGETGDTSGGDSATQPPSETPPPAASASAIDPASDGYTLIVGSSLSRASANSAMARYANLGHPVAVLSYPDGDGNTRHRIAVGEFDSADDADSARRAMASRLPDGTWVRRIRR